MHTRDYECFTHTHTHYNDPFPIYKFEFPKSTRSPAAAAAAGGVAGEVSPLRFDAKISNLHAEEERILI